CKRDDQTPVYKCQRASSHDQPVAANAMTARSISVASRILIALASTPNDDAADWTAPYWPSPPEIMGSRRTATRIIAGAICLSRSNHFPPMLYSKSEKPVALPPGRARLST